MHVHDSTSINRYSNTRKQVDTDIQIKFYAKFKEKK